MLIKTIVVGPLQVSCFVIADEKSGKAMVVDPGDEPDMIMETINGSKLQVQYIVCTHGHFDHVGAVGDIKNETGAKVAIHEEDLALYNSAKESAAAWGFSTENPPAPDLFVKDGDALTIGELSFEVIHSPGHSPGGICLYEKGVIVTGDTLFAGSVGRADFHGGDIEKLKKSFRRLMLLPDDTKVLPGHGPATTIGREKKMNMFAEEFLR